MNTNKDLEKLVSLMDKYVRSGVYKQHKIDMFNYILNHWNNE